MNVLRQKSCLATVLCMLPASLTQIENMMIAHSEDEPAEGRSSLRSSRRLAHGFQSSNASIPVPEPHISHSVQVVPGRTGHHRKLYMSVVFKTHLFRRILLCDTFSSESHSRIGTNYGSTRWKTEERESLPCTGSVSPADLRT